MFQLVKYLTTEPFIQPGGRGGISSNHKMWLEIWGWCKPAGKPVEQILGAPNDNCALGFTNQSMC